MLLPLEDQTIDKPAFYEGRPWLSCRPFVENSRAVLIHRPRSVTMFQIGGRRAHIAIGMWCGNTHTGREKFTFLDVPPHGRIVCARCEANAIEAGLPTTDQLAGEHVHIGGVVAVRRCCIEPATHPTKDTP